jgi:hypothetical protein
MSLLLRPLGTHAALEGLKEHVFDIVNLRHFAELLMKKPPHGSRRMM